MADCALGVTYLGLIFQQFGEVDTAGEDKNDQADDPGSSVRQLVLRPRMMSSIIRPNLSQSYHYHLVTASSLSTATPRIVKTDPLSDIWVNPRRTGMIRGKTWCL